MMRLNKIIFIGLVVSSTVLQAVSPKPGSNFQPNQSAEVQGQTSTPKKNNLGRKLGWIVASIGAAAALNATQNAWFPSFEKITATTVTGDVVKKQKSLILEIIKYDSENDLYVTEYEEIDDPVVLFLYEKLGLDGVVSEILAELGDQAVDLEISSFDEELEYELVVKVDGETTARTFETSEDLFDDVKKGRDYRFKVSKFDMDKIVDLVRAR